MKQIPWSALTPLSLSGTLSVPGSDLVALVIAGGAVAVALIWAVGQFWFKPYMESRNAAWKTSRRPAIPVCKTARTKSKSTKAQ